MVKFHAAGSSLRHCCFSSDGKLIAAAAGSTAHVWDTTSSNAYPIKTFVGHTGRITSLAFSSLSSLISSSHDNSVKLWEIGILQADPVVTDPESTSPTSAPIVSITLQLEDGIAISSDFDGVVRTWDISTGLCKSSFQTLDYDSELSDVQLINSRLILVWYLYKKIHIWDVGKGRRLQTVDVTLGTVEDFRISGDGSSVLCLNQQSIQALSIQTGEVVCEVGLEYCKLPRFLTVDGSSVWVHSAESEPLGWDLGTPGSPPAQLSNSPLTFPNNIMLWDIKQSRIKDAVTGRVVFQLAGRFANPVKSQWDGHYLVTGHRSGEVLILDFNHVHP